MAELKFNPTNQLTSAPTSIPTAIPTANPMANPLTRYTNAPTSHPTANPPVTPTPNPFSTLAIDLFCQGTAKSNVFTVEINGQMSIEGAPISDASIQLSYSTSGGDSWQSLTIVKTQSDGTFAAVWNQMLQVTT